MNLKLPNGRGKNRLVQMADFASRLTQLHDQIGMKISSRGWCYQLEGFGLITKAEFDKIEKIINECRKKGYLPVDFVLGGLISLIE